MKKLFILLASLYLLAGCAESIALLGPVTGMANGNVVNSSLRSAVSYGVKKKTGKTPTQHALAYAKEVNPNKKKEKCISFIEKTNSEVCMIAKKQISLAQSSITKKIKVNIKAGTEKPAQIKDKVYDLFESKKLPRNFFLTLKTKIKKYDERWLDRIEKSSLHQ